MGIPEKIQTHMDWKTFKKTTSTLLKHRQLFILKHSAGTAVTGRNMVQRKERSTSKCPRCGAQDEHMEHIIQCPDPDANKTFSTAFADMGIWLSKMTTKEIETAITDLVLECRQDTNIQDMGDNSNNDNINGNICQAMERQQKIGLHAFMCGFLCSNWISLQSIHLQQTGLRRCANKWATQLVGKLIDIIFDMWNHQNEVLHKKDKHEEMNRTIEQLFSDLPNMLNRDFLRTQEYNKSRNETYTGKVNGLRRHKAL